MLSQPLLLILFPYTTLFRSQQELLFQEVRLLPSKIIVRDVEEHLFATIRINGLGQHVFAAEMHVGRVCHRDHIFRQSKTGSHAVIIFVGSDEKHVVPNFILTNLMLDRFPREYQTDAGAILYFQSMMIAVVNLKLQIAAGRYAQRITWWPRLRQMARKVDRRHDI